MSEQLSLLKLQEQFTSCLLDNNLPTGSLPIVDLGQPINDKRLDIYRNNVFYSLLMALSDLYPVFKRLTGDDFFNGTGIAYLKNHPPTQAAMVHFGTDFPVFIENFEHTEQHKWLIDITRLELALHQSYHEADSTSIDAGTLTAVPAEKLAGMQVKLLPSVRLISSPYPIYQIWLANQDEHENDETIDLDSGGNYLCIHRPDYDVLANEVDQGTFIFLSKLSEGNTLENSIIKATESVSGFAADKALADCLNNKLIEKIYETS